MGVDLLFRKAVLSTAQRPRVRRWFEKHGMNWGVQRFVAGRTLEEAIGRVRRMNRDGLLVTLDFLGESVEDREQAAAVGQVILEMLDEMNRRRLKCNISLKLSQLGLLVDEQLCREQLETIVGRAKDEGNFVRIDMEDSMLTDRTLSLFKHLLELYGPMHVGTVLQSYLYRSEQDAEELTALGANLRIVKGAYREPKQIAYASKEAVDASYLRLVNMSLDRGRYVAVATHDSKLIDRVIRYTQEQHIPSDRFEFQMLYGIAGGLQRQLADAGYRVRVYTPFGEQWYPYFSRRIAERPANLWFVVKNLWR
ncbi:proline dehydrogenase family protein [Paenibacillus sp. y28]|uniref:proline dehydrogenase family protein n=1 Tax=Paenibacillus sp. y28 TaxID=3129110 RepID=UPI00301B6B32